MSKAMLLIGANQRRASCRAMLCRCMTEIQCPAPSGSRCLLGRATASKMTVINLRIKIMKSSTEGKILYKIMYSRLSKIMMAMSSQETMWRFRPKKSGAHWLSDPIATQIKIKAMFRGLSTWPRNAGRAWRAPTAWTRGKLVSCWTRGRFLKTKKSSRLLAWFLRSRRTPSLASRSSKSGSRSWTRSWRKQGSEARIAFWKTWFCETAYCRCNRGQRDRARTTMTSTAKVSKARICVSFLRVQWNKW